LADFVRLHYLSASLLPSREANSVHVMKMCQAFARQLSDRGQGADVRLFARANSRDRRDPFAVYGVAPVFKTVLSRPPNVSVVRTIVRLAYVVRCHLGGPRPDLCYVRDPLAMLVLSWLRRIPFVLEVHHMPASRFQGRAVARLLKLHECRGLVAISQALANDYAQAHPSLAERIPVVVAPDGADVPAHRPPRAARQTVHVGYAGSVLPGRGVELIAELARRHPGVRFRIAGDPKEAAARFDADGPPANVEFAGYLPHGEVTSFLAACDVLLAPYQRQVSIASGFDTARWMSPLKIFEYMAAGRLVLCSDLPALREVDPEAEALTFLPPDDTDAWSAALAAAADNPARLDTAGRATHELVQQRFSWDRRAEALVAHFAPDDGASGANAIKDTKASACPPSSAA
jgi:glycosyltransferase involved in cell wall biosynthesis